MIWIQSSSYIKPKKVDDTISKKYVYIRKDITRVEAEIDGVEVVYYTYMEAKVEKEEYYIVATCVNNVQEQADENTEDIEDAEDAICELSETMDDAIAALEQAICDLSEEIGEGEE